MPNLNTRNRPDMAPAEIATTYLDERDDALLDAVITASSLVASADGRVSPAERRLAIDFLADNGFLSVSTRAEILEAFDRRVWEFQEDGGAKSAVDSLRRFAGFAPARLIVSAGEHVAAADGHLSPHELHMLRLIRIALAAPGSHRAGG
jgi:tellurite resistance protein